MKLQSGSYVLTFASGQSYNGSKRQFVIFQTHKDQKISDVTATAKSGKNSEILLGNTSIYGVFYRSDGQLILNSTKIYSSLYLTVYSNETTDFGCDTQVVLLGNATAVLVTKNYPGAAPGYGVFISKKHEGYCFYSAFVPVEIVASTYLEGSFSISQYDINGNYISSRDSILNLYQYRYPFVTHILGVRDNEGPSLLGFYVSTEEYNFKTAILVDNEKADARFVSISDTNCTLEIIIAVAAGVVIIIIIVSIVFCCYCCCCKKKKKDNAESKSSSSDSSHNI
ncbi:hypothetical protein TVAG_257640 [Trichomonas vaginalis G3]|uniref:Uncharacterized protein n=1 Tax=Trichomonas vaginalis (strain ATCC PRA-98 / G3) TaxID=412133 RepID=A2F4E5_TRIV3|nr:hypothetical protein TVAGG3_1031480 [Trichomonas vaginalis G3]EAY00210.1 hypothetical protein TVAG_257640 [Trichomonas vaginalis G3]KAI5492900.1 hypothetical protein TVAGG3_1031480 [Trichomonas vaginalis G3]|eukprot:XP_001313139.1 hypothetical protein [Trichomonas vaginalis G3]